jgi:DNA repair protein RAD7
LTLYNAYQLKDTSIDYMLDKSHNLTDLRIYAANLVNNEKWSELFKKLGKNLKTLKLRWLDASFTDQQISDLVKYCPNLTRLKLEIMWKITPDSLEEIGKLEKLEHLSLEFLGHQHVSNEDVETLITKVGHGLKTLSLRNFVELNDDGLWAIRVNCKQLTKLRITGTDQPTDAGWDSLFNGWSNPPLLQADFSGARDVDNHNPDGPQEEEGEDPVGFGSQGFKALMRHSGAKIRKLNLASCRHISLGTLLDVFAGETVEGVPAEYPELQEVDLSFVNEMDDVALNGLTRSSPKLKRVLLFGNFGIGSEVHAPKGVVIIGPPRVLDEGMEFYGNEDVVMGNGIQGMDIGGFDVPEHIKRAMQEEMGLQIIAAGGEAMDMD